MALALIHVVGALVASTVFGILTLLITGWEQGRVQKRRLQDASMSMGVKIESLTNDESLIPRFLQYSSDRFSGELLRNRFSDLCGALRTGWGWLGWVLQVGTIIGVGWAMYTSGADNAVFMWLVLAISVIFWLLSVAFSFACLLLTGRYPGEAKAGRAGVVSLLAQQEASAKYRAMTAPHSDER